MNGSATKWMKTSIAGKYEKCSNGNISNGNHVFYKEIVNVSSIHTKVTSTKTTTTANMTLDSETGEETVTEYSVSSVSGIRETVGTNVEVNYNDNQVDKSDKANDSDDSEEENNSKGLTKSFLDGLTICQYKLKCMALDQNKMNHSKVHVDESEPTGHEEVPFESRDVKIRNGCWITDEYDVSEILLGRGKFGEVKQCKERKTGRELAAKFIEVNGPQDRFDVQNEIEMMKNLQHPRLLQLYDVFTKRNHFCLVLELISGGELFERVINDDFILTEKACIMFMRQICEGIDFMHNNSILHLDLKPENILCLTREGNRIKIIDFGLARRYKPEEDLRILFGTPEFMAPEQANFEPIFPSTDMWSIGIICYILLSGLSPFLGESENETIGNITEAKWDFKAEEFESISAEAKDFISKLILKDHTKRMTATECLEHKWLRRSAKRERIPTRSLSTKRLKKFVYRRKWQKAVNAMLALKRMGVKL
ncbi:myosin light chain kinase family member 4-like isoform X1 [Mercenaria mercenaria]|uniref:myosin light chain kinase family member 4-like isoform X1 n=2 Tax=Mercenaria mercenaria TaxID=6596 RepID=UPI00234F38C6|nr:myosin light chain kinase family member 4-like isoform X1 [Mercenaria mercenaria]